MNVKITILNSTFSIANLLACYGVIKINKLLINKYVIPYFANNAYEKTSHLLVNNLTLLACVSGITIFSTMIPKGKRARFISTMLCGTAAAVWLILDKKYHILFIFAILSPMYTIISVVNRQNLADDLGFKSSDKTPEYKFRYVEGFGVVCLLTSLSVGIGYSVNKLLCNALLPHDNINAYKNLTLLPCILLCCAGSVFTISKIGDVLLNNKIIEDVLPCNLKLISLTAITTSLVCWTKMDLKVPCIIGLTGFIAQYAYVNNKQSFTSAIKVMAQTVGLEF